MSENLEQQVTRGLPQNPPAQTVVQSAPIESKPKKTYHQNCRIDFLKNLHGLKITVVTSCKNIVCDICFSKHRAVFFYAV